MILYDLPDHEYHARTELSSTGARLLLEAPAKFKYRLDHPQQGKRAFDVGTAAHTKILGVGSGLVEYPAEHLTPSGAVSTKAATILWAEEQRTAGLTPVSPADITAVNAMAESVLAHPKARELLEAKGHREVSVISEIDGVPVRARLDGLVELEGMTGLDLKTTRKTADVEGFSRTSSDFGYFVQEVWYREAIEAEGAPLDRFVFITVEKEPPYLVGVNVQDIIFQMMGKAATAEARRRYRHGMATGDWPGYSQEIEAAAPPAWMAMMYDEKYGTELTL